MKHKFAKRSRRAFSLEEEREKATHVNEQRLPSIHLNRYIQTGSLKTIPADQTAAKKLFEMNNKSSLIRQFYARARKNKRSSKISDGTADVMFTPTSADDGATTTASSSRTFIIHEQSSSTSYPIFDCEYGQSDAIVGNNLLYNAGASKTRLNLAYQSDSDDNVMEVNCVAAEEYTNPQRKSKSKPRHHRRSEINTIAQSVPAAQADFENGQNKYNSESDDPSHQDVEKIRKNIKHRKKRRTGGNTSAVTNKSKAVSQSRMSSYYNKEVVRAARDETSSESCKLEEVLSDIHDLCSWVDETNFGTTSNELVSISNKKPISEIRTHDDDRLSSEYPINTNLEQVDQLQRESAYELISVNQRPAVGSESSLSDDHQVCFEIKNGSSHSPTVFISGTNSPNDQHSESFNPRFSDHLSSGASEEKNVEKHCDQGELFAQRNHSRTQFLSGLIDQSVVSRIPNSNEPSIENFSRVKPNFDDNTTTRNKVFLDVNVAQQSNEVLQDYINNFSSKLNIEATNCSEINGSGSEMRNELDDSGVLSTELHSDAQSQPISFCNTVSEDCTEVRGNRVRRKPVDESAGYSWVDEYWKCSASSASSDVSEKDLSLLSASFPAMLWQDWTARHVRKNSVKIETALLV